MLSVFAMIALQIPPNFADLAKQVDPMRLKATVEKLASWHDRNLNNPTIDEAAEWIAGEYRKIPGMQVEVWHYPVKQGRRVKADRDVPEVIAVLPGETDRRILIGGHLDTINMTGSEQDQWTLPSPGADDDASGTAMALEVARVMAGRKWHNTMVFCAFTGEEQGLFGSRALAQRAKAEGWKLDAVMSSDVIGASKNSTGQSDPHHIRVFSEELAPGAHNAQGELIPHHESREFARIIEFFTRKQLPDFSVKLIFRADRFGRGGDHSSFNREGFTAVRFTEPYEDYTHQHTANDKPEFVDFNFLANVSRINLIAAANLAGAGDPPANVRVSRAQSHDAHITWRSAPGQNYIVYWRETTSPVWQSFKNVGAVDTITIPNVSKDDFVFAVGAPGGIPVEAR